MVWQFTSWPMGHRELLSAVLVQVREAARLVLEQTVREQ